MRAWLRWRWRAQIARRDAHWARLDADEHPDDGYRRRRVERACDYRDRLETMRP